MPTGAQLVLASKSPRRIELLANLGLQFDVEVADVDEERIAADLSADDAVVVLAQAKAQRVRDRLGDGDERRVGDGDERRVIAADTLVVLDGVPIGKPKSAEQLTSWFGAYSGRSIEVVTGVAVTGLAVTGLAVTGVAVAGASSAPGAEIRTELLRTAVTFTTIERAEIERYVSSGVGDDKAGGLELQGAAAPFIDEVRGCWTNVLGLPLCSVARLLGPVNSSTAAAYSSAVWCVTRDGRPCDHGA